METDIINKISKKDEINTPESLKGKKIGGPKGTILHQVLVGYLGKGNLKEEDVEFINMGLPDALAAMESGRIDAALLAGPVALKAIKNGVIIFKVFDTTPIHKLPV